MDRERRRLQLHGLALARRGDQFALDADAGAGGDARDHFRRHHAGVEHDLQVDRRRAVVELDEVHVLAVAAGLHPAPGSDRSPGERFSRLRTY